MKLNGLWLITGDSQSLRVLVMTNLIGHLLIFKGTHCVKVRLSYISSDVTGQYLPDDVNVTLRTGNNTAWHMHLRHVKYKSRDIPLYTVQVGEDGEHVRKRLDVRIRQNTGFYRDQSQLSLVRITRTNDVTDTVAVLQLKGQIFLNGKLYSLTSHARDSRFVTSWSVTSDDDLYVLEMIKAPPFPTTDPYETWSTLPFPDTTNDFPPNRPVRQASGTYIIDVAVMVDYFGYQQFYKLDGIFAEQTLLEFTAFVMAEVDEIYQTIRNTTFKIRVSLIRVIVMKRAGWSPFTEKHVEPGSNNVINVTSSLNAFVEYIIGDGEDIIGEHDHVMLFSGGDLASFVNETMDQEIVGIAPFGSLCQMTGKSSSIVEIVIENSASLIAAHFLGHNMGAAHDGEANICNFYDRYIMAASTSKETPETQLNPWQFSSCSIESFNKFLTKSITTPALLECLSDSLAIEVAVPIVTGRFQGLDLPLDTQCERSFGTGAYFCRTPGMVYADVCRANTCYQPSKGACVSTPVAKGTRCGNGKLCIRGDCVKHPMAPKADDNCVFGDSKGAVANNFKCGEHVNVNLGACYHAEFLVYCCQSCKQLYWGVKGCEYGDRHHRCKVADCKLSRNRRVCCRKCNPNAPKLTTPPDEEKQNKTPDTPGSETPFPPTPTPPQGETNGLSNVVYALPIMIAIVCVTLYCACFCGARRRTLSASQRAKKAEEEFYAMQKSREEEEDLNDENDIAAEEEDDGEEEVEPVEHYLF